MAAPASHGRLDSPFFRAKFRVPTGPRHFVRRRRLLTLLDDLTEYPVTLIAAPAGAGKTVLAADWVRHSQRPCAWVTLDAADRDATQLWGSLVTAIDLMVPGTITGRSRRLPAHEDISAVLARLQHPATDDTPLMLVLDDVDRVDDDEGAAALLAAFVDYRPAWLHLLVLSRRRPPLQVDRLRAGGDLADIHFDALRFSRDEAAALLTSLCPDLQDPDLLGAVGHADGWAAALQLTALSIRSHGAASPTPIDAADAPDKLVNEYLWEEVLGPERPELVGLLLSTAIVRRVNYALAEALTRRPDAGDLLEQAEAAGLFVTALDAGWFEVHSLVRDVLLSRLQRRWPDNLRTQHARAARWFENAGDEVAALDHWLLADQPKDALRVLSELALPLLDAGRATRVVDALEQIPADTIAVDPDQAVRYAWSQLAAGRSAFADALPMTDAAVDAGVEPARTRSETLHAVARWLQGDWTHLTGGTLDPPEPPALTTPGDPVDRFGWHLVGCGLALDECWDEEAAAVREARAASLRDPRSRGAFDAARALGLALAGRPLAARRAVEGASRTGETDRPGTARIQLALANAVVERELDHRGHAEAVLEQLAGTPTYPDPVMQLVAQLELVRLRMSTGDIARASASLADAERMHAWLASPTAESAEPTAATPATASATLVARVGVDLALATDDGTAALRWTSYVDDRFWGPACEAKVWLARSRQAEALDVLERARPRCPRQEVVLGLLVGRAIATQDRTSAGDRIGSALELAAGHGMLRAVAAEGTAVTDLIELAAWRVPEDWMDALRHALVPTWVAQDALRPVEDLTERECEVLRLLPSRLTLGEIAGELYVSQNTLKFHLRAIYRKLGVVSRAEAVDAARQMRLLPHG